MMEKLHTRVETLNMELTWEYKSGSADLPLRTSFLFPFNLEDLLQTSVVYLQSWLQTIQATHQSAAQHWKMNQCGKQWEMDGMQWKKSSSHSNSKGCNQ